MLYILGFGVAKELGHNFTARGTWQSGKGWKPVIPPSVTCWSSGSDLHKRECCIAVLTRYVIDGDDLRFRWTCHRHFQVVCSTYVRKTIPYHPILYRSRSPHPVWYHGYHMTRRQPISVSRWSRTLQRAAQWCRAVVRSRTSCARRTKIEHLRLLWLWDSYKTTPVRY